MQSLLDQRKAEGRGQEAGGIYPDAEGTSLLATKGSRGFKPPLNSSSVAPVQEGLESPPVRNLLPSASCLLPSQLFYTITIFLIHGSVIN